MIGDCIRIFHEYSISFQYIDLKSIRRIVGKITAKVASEEVIKANKNHSQGISRRRFKSDYAYTDHCNDTLVHTRTGYLNGSELLPKDYEIRCDQSSAASVQRSLEFSGWPYLMGVLLSHQCAVQKAIPISDLQDLLRSLVENFNKICFSEWMFSHENDEISLRIGIQSILLACPDIAICWLFATIADNAKRRLVALDLQSTVSPFQQVSDTFYETAYLYFMCIECFLVRSFACHQDIHVAILTKADALLDSIVHRFHMMHNKEEYFTFFRQICMFLHRITKLFRVEMQCITQSGKRVKKTETLVGNAASFGYSKFIEMSLKVSFLSF